METLALIVPLYLVPEDGIVRKITGTYTYRVKRKIHIFANLEDKEKINTPEVTGQGVIFLISERGSINAYPDTKKVVWEADEEKIFRFLQDRKLERESS